MLGDCDGLCSAAIIHQYLHQISPSIQINVLYHAGKQHGLDLSILEQIDDNSLLIIPDASVNDIKYIEELHAKNINVVQLDHHDIQIEADNVICVNNQFGKVKNKYGSGALVTQKFCQYIDKQLGTKYANNYVDLVALSLVSDSMDLRSLENRVYLFQGLKQPVNPFYKYLCDNLIKGNLTPHELSFKIINQLNAVQRSSNQELKAAIFDCFVGNRDDFADVLKQCKAEKRNQDNIVKEILEELIPQIDDSQKVIFAYTNEAEGYSGLLANKLTSRYSRPVMVLHRDGNDYIGSARSPYDGFREFCEHSGLFNFASGKLLPQYALSY